MHPCALQKVTVCVLFFTSRIKFSVSNEAFHELSMVSNLPNSSQINSLTCTLNEDFSICSTPNGVVGVQQSLWERLMVRLTHLNDKSSEQGDVPNTIRIKLTGDGTQIARGLSVVNINFTMLEEGQTRACSAFGNHSIVILRVSENYKELKPGLEDIIAEAEDLEVLTIRDKVYSVQFFLGGDLKVFSSCVESKQQILNMHEREHGGWQQHMVQMP